MKIGSIAGIAVTGWFTLIVALILSGCGRKDEPSPAATPPDSAPVERVDDEAAAEPLLHRMVRFAPADPLLTAVAPSLDDLERNAMALAARLAPPETDVSDLVAAWSRRWALAMGTGPEATPAGVIRELGITPSQPVALYVDADAFTQRLIAALETRSAQVDDAGEIDTAVPDEDLDSDILDVTELAGFPAAALGFTVHDPDGVRARLEGLLRRSPQWESFEKHEVEHSGIRITVYDPEYCAYFLHDDLFFVSNDLGWLTQVADRVQAPGPLPEVLAGAPATNQQLVFFLRTDQAQPLMQALATAAAEPGEAGPMAQMQASVWEQSKELYAGVDPVVGILTWDESRIALDMRINLDQHPAIREVTGAGSPMRLASALPATTLAMASLKLNPEAKAAVRKYWIDAMPPAVFGDPVMLQSMMGANQALEVIDDEITVGVTGVAEGMPTGLVMVALTDPDQMIPMVNMLLILSGGQPLKMPDAPGAIEEVTVADAVLLYYTLLDKTLLVGNRRDDVASAVANLQTPTASGYFESLSPPMDPELPRYLTVSVKPEALQRAMDAQDEATEENEMLRRSAEVVKEVRMTQEVDGPWLFLEISLHLR
jgi:hypothetical protein